MDENINANVDELYNQVLESKIKGLARTSPGSKEEALATTSVTKLYAAKQARDNAESEKEAQMRAAQLEQDKFEADKKAQKKSRIISCVVEGCKLLIPLAGYGVFYCLGLKFEEEGTFSSKTFQRMLNRFKLKY